MSHLRGGGHAKPVIFSVAMTRFSVPLIIFFYFQVFHRDSAMRSAMIVFAHMFEPVEPPPLNKGVKALLALWCTFLPFWLLLSLGAAAFRTNVGGNLFVTSWGFYPVLLLIAFVFKRSRPYLTLLPALSLVAMFISGEVDNLLRHT